MKAYIPLDDMTVEEKLQAIEMLWEDLCKQQEDVPSPIWHGDVLEELDKAVSTGKEVTQDWESAKRAIRDKIG